MHGHKELARRIDQLFRNKGVNNAEVGRALGGITGQTVGRWRRSGCIRDDHLRALAKYFGVSYYELKEDPSLNGKEAVINNPRSRDFLGRERRRMIDEIIKDDERLRLVTRASNIGHWELDIPTNEFTASLETEKLFSVEPGSLDGPLRIVDAHIHPDDLHLFYGSIQKAIYTDNGTCDEMPGEEDTVIRINRKSGGMLWLKIANQVVSIDGSPTKMVGIFQDITREKQIEIKEHRLQLAMDAAKIGSWDLELMTDKLVWSNRTKRIFGMEDVENNTLALEDFNASIHPDDKDKVWQAFGSARDNKGKRYRVDHRIMLDKGKIKWVRETGEFLYDSNGVATNVVGITQDITEEVERKELYEQINTAMELARLRLWANDIESGYITLMSQEGKQVVALDQLLNHINYHPEDMIKIIAVRDRIVAGEDSITIEYRYRKTEMEEFKWYRTTAKAVRDSKGVLNKIVGASHEIDAEKRQAPTQQIRDQ